MRELRETMGTWEKITWPFIVKMPQSRRMPAPLLFDRIKIAQHIMILVWRAFMQAKNRPTIIIALKSRQSRKFKSKTQDARIQSNAQPTNLQLEPHFPLPDQKPRVSAAGHHLHRPLLFRKPCRLRTMAVSIHHHLFQSIVPPNHLLRLRWANLPLLLHNATFHRPPEEPRLRSKHTDPRLIAEIRRNLWSLAPFITRIPTMQTSCLIHH